MLLRRAIYPSTPTAGLEVILGQIPLELYIKQRALETFIRINKTLGQSWSGIGHGAKRGHRWLLNQLANEAGIKNPNYESTCGTKRITKHFNLGTCSRANQIPAGNNVLLTAKTGSVNTKWGLRMNHHERTHQILGCTAGTTSGWSGCPIRTYGCLANWCEVVSSRLGGRPISAKSI